MTIAQYILGGILGFLYGTAVAYITGKITENYIRKNTENGDPMKKASGFSASRQIVNALALVVLFLLHGVLDGYFVPTLIGALISIGLMSYVFLFRIAKRNHNEE